ncbi:MAG: hypothetical protein MI723_16805, partial [Caulobacterales bacterium]|nr:hypothetical protein [Caulobacterales bacterium]
DHADGRGTVAGGAVIGGLLGALAGAAASPDDSAEGAVAGAIVGGVLGGAAGCAYAKRETRRANRDEPTLIAGAPTERRAPPAPLAPFPRTLAIAARPPAWER